MTVPFWARGNAGNGAGFQNLILCSSGVRGGSKIALLIARDYRVCASDLERNSKCFTG